VDIKSIPAHTNAVGQHRLSEIRVNSSTGVIWDYNSQEWQPYNNIDAIYSVDSALSDKPATLHWDFHSNSNYSRGVQRIVEDRPGRHRVSWYNPTDGHTASYDWVETSYLSSRATPLTSFPSIPQGIYDNMIAEAKTKCLNKLLDEKAQIGAALGEARQTIDAFADLVKDGARYLNAFKRRNLRNIIKRNGGKSFGESLQDAWLQYSYGWKPLAGDIYAAQRNVHRILARGAIIAAKAGVNYEDDIAYHSDSGDYDESTHVKQQVLCQLGARLQGPEIAYLNTFGLINPFSIAWELVPWSFAIDWFVPVGATLEAVTATVGLDFWGGRITTRRSYDLKRTYVPDRRTAWRVCEDIGEYHEEGFGFQRTALTAFPAPQLYADITPYSTIRALNALALVRQLTHGGSPRVSHR
jgi:hypothetical protein